MRGQLAGKVVVVTGCASGIGQAIAEAVAAEGAAVEGVDRQEVRESQVADISDVGDVERVVADIKRRRNHIDALVNCAGIWASGTVVTTDQELWDRIFAVNVRGAFLMSRAVIPSLEARGGGSIVNIASNYGLVGGRNAAAYAASKGAVVALTRAMALDHAAAGIRVNCICPGTVDTPLIRRPMREMVPEEARALTASRLARHPLGRIGTPADIAPGTVYLISDGSSFVTGAVLPIDGGYTAQ
ncbi:MAG: SDR family oxidoreductase [Luteitalea sp.]|nr:SDR family oxidoreductase [Luteitalea sp.]